jgi:hypothetical protein
MCGVGTLDELYDFVARRRQVDRGFTEDITQEAWRQDGLRKVVQSAPAAKSTLRNEPYVGTALTDARLKTARTAPNPPHNPSLPPRIAPCPPPPPLAAPARTALPDRFNGQPKRLSACDDGSGGRLT